MRQRRQLKSRLQRIPGVTCVVRSSSSALAHPAFCLGNCSQTPGSTRSSSSRNPRTSARPHSRRRARARRRRADRRSRRRASACVARGSFTTERKSPLTARAHRFKALTGKAVMVYGQTEVTRDLMDARAAGGAPTVYEALDVSIHDIETDHPSVRYREGRRSISRWTATIVAGCDGFHGVSRRSIPRRRCCRPTSGSIRSAGLASWSTSRRSRTS